LEIRGARVPRRAVVASVNKKVDEQNVQAVTTNVSALTALLAATIGGPVVKVAAFTYGVRSALADRPGTRTRRKVADQTRANKAAARAAKRRKAD